MCRHNSKWRPTVKEEFVSNKTECKTMGPAKHELRGPEKFIKKHEKEFKLPESKTYLYTTHMCSYEWNYLDHFVLPGKPYQYPDADQRRPPVPAKDDQPILGLKTTKDFIRKNAVENIMSVPKKPAKAFADTRKGDTFPLTPSGLEPKYVHKKVSAHSDLKTAPLTLFSCTNIAWYSV